MRVLRGMLGGMLGMHAVQRAAFQHVPWLAARLLCLAPSPCSGCGRREAPFSPPTCHVTRPTLAHLIPSPYWHVNSALSPSKACIACRLFPRTTRPPCVARPAPPAGGHYSVLWRALPVLCALPDPAGGGGGADLRGVSQPTADSRSIKWGHSTSRAAQRSVLRRGHASGLPPTAEWP